MIQHPPKHLLVVACLCLAAAALGGCNMNDDKSEGGPTEALAAQSFRRDWSADLNLKNDEIDRVFALEDVIVAYTRKQQAYVVNRDTGLIRFTAQVTESTVRPYAPVLLKDKIVFPTSATLELYRRDGRQIRSYTTRHSLRTNAVGSPTGTRLYFGVDHPGSGRMVCLETAPGSYEPVRQIWELMSDKGAPINAAPAVFQDAAYVAFDDGWVYAVNAENRQSIWSTSLGPQYRTYGPIQADLRADEFGVYVPSTDTKFYCLNRNDGREKWVYYAGAILRQSAEVTASTVYLPVTGKGIVAIDKATGPQNGKPKWSVADAVKFLAEDEKYAYLQRRDNTIVAVDRTTGQPAFTNRRKDLITFATNTRPDGLIYAGTREGRIIAIAPVLKPGFMGEVARWEPVVDGDPRETVAMK